MSIDHGTTNYKNQCGGNMTLGEAHSANQADDQLFGESKKLQFSFFYWMVPCMAG